MQINGSIALQFTPGASPPVRLTRCSVLLGLAIGWLHGGGRLCAQDLVPTDSSQPIPANVLGGGGEWINTKEPLQLDQLRGKFVLLDFWTYCCINCLHTLPDLKKLEKEYPNQLVVIGVHAPKFAGERDSENVREAVLRHDITHPVVNDANGIIARSFQVTGWPSLRLLDPQGRLIASHFGEISFDSLNAYMKRAVAKSRQKRVLDESPVRFAIEPFVTKPSELRFPGKIVADRQMQRLLVADSGNHRILILSFDGKWHTTIGSGLPGLVDGPLAAARFQNPQGIAADGDVLYVADTDNHAIRKVDLQGGTVETIAGNGQQAIGPARMRVSSAPKATRLASPWDLALHDQDLYIAMAGTHQIWRLSVDKRRLAVFAGTGEEDIVDGPVTVRAGSPDDTTCFAQPSGLAFDGQRIFVADSEGSSIRSFPVHAKGNVVTILGTAGLAKPMRLFTFGDRDGPLSSALLQHPLGLAYGSSRLYVADTYNNKIKEVNLTDRSIRTLIVGGTANRSSGDLVALNEPGGLSVADQVLYIADTNNHCIRMVALDQPSALKTLALRGVPANGQPSHSVPGAANQTRQSFGEHTVRAEARIFTFELQLELPRGASISTDAPATYRVQVVDGNLILDSQFADRLHTAQPKSNRLVVPVRVVMEQGTARLTLDVDFFYCEKLGSAVCRVARGRWSGQVTLDPQSPTGQIEIETKY